MSDKKKDDLAKRLELSDAEKAQAQRVRQHIDQLESRVKHMSMILAALMLKFGKRDLIYAPGKVPDEIKVHLNTKDVQAAMAMWDFKQYHKDHPDLPMNPDGTPDGILLTLTPMKAKGGGNGGLSRG